MNASFRTEQCTVSHSLHIMESLWANCLLPRGKASLMRTEMFWLGNFKEPCTNIPSFFPELKQISLMCSSQFPIIGAAHFPSQGLYRVSRKGTPPQLAAPFAHPAWVWFVPVKPAKIHRHVEMLVWFPSPAGANNSLRSIKNSPSSFRGSQLSARLPLFSWTQSWHLHQGHILSGSTGWTSSHLWEATQRGT